MTTSTNKLIDIDAEFDDVYFDEPSIKKRTASLNKHEDPEFRKKFLDSREKLSNNPDWAKQHSEITKNLLKDPAHRKKIKESAKKKVENPGWRESQQKAAESRKNNPLWKINNQIGKSNSELYQKSFKEKCERFKIPFMTRHGAFESKKDAGIFYDVDVGMISYWIKIYPDEFYKMTKDEYKKIKHIPNLPIDENTPHPRKKKKQIK